MGDWLRAPLPRRKQSGTEILINCASYAVINQVDVTTNAGHVKDARYSYLIQLNVWYCLNELVEC